MEVKGISYSANQTQFQYNQQEQKKEEVRESEAERELELMKRMLEHMEQRRKQEAENLKKQAAVAVKKKINYRMGRDMAKLGRVSQDRFVRSFISGVYARRAQIKGNGSYDSREKAEVMAQMDHVIRCARNKIKQLKEEKILENMEQKLQQERLEKERIRVQQELKSRKTKRMAREQARVFEDIPDLPGLRDRYEQQAVMAEYFARTGMSGTADIGGVNVGNLSESAIQGEAPAVTAGADVSMTEIV